MSTVSLVRIGRHSGIGRRCHVSLWLPPLCVCVCGLFSASTNLLTPKLSPPDLYCPRIALQNPCLLASSASPLWHMAAHDFTRAKSLTWLLHDFKGEQNRQESGKAQVSWFSCTELKNWWGFINPDVHELSEDPSLYLTLASTRCGVSKPNPVSLFTEPVFFFSGTLYPIDFLKKFLVTNATVYVWELAGILYTENFFVTQGMTNAQIPAVGNVYDLLEQPLQRPSILCGSFQKSQLFPAMKSVGLN